MVGWVVENLDFELSLFWGFELDSNGDAMGIDRAGIYGGWDYGERRVKGSSRVGERGKSYMPLKRPLLLAPHTLSMRGCRVGQVH
jgi:hypothetical protein